MLLTIQLLVLEYSEAGVWNDQLDLLLSTVAEAGGLRFQLCIGSTTLANSPPQHASDNYFAYCELLFPKRDTPDWSPTLLDYIIVTWLIS